MGWIFGEIEYCHMPAVEKRTLHHSVFRVEYWNFNRAVPKDNYDEIMDKFDIY